MKELNEIHDELQEAPLLRSLKGRAGGSDLPDGYFDGFADRLTHRLEDADLAAQAPTVFSASRKPYFRSPEGYFEAFPGRVMARLSSGRVVSFMPGWFTAIPVQAMAVAAALTLLIGIFLTQPQTASVQPVAPGLSSEELAEVVDWHSLDVDVIEAMYEEEIVALTETNPESNTLFDEEFGPLLDQLDASDIQHLILN